MQYSLEYFLNRHFIEAMQTFKYLYLSTLLSNMQPILVVAPTELHINPQPFIIVGETLLQEEVSYQADDLLDNFEVLLNVLAMDDSEGVPSQLVQPFCGHRLERPAHEGVIVEDLMETCSVQGVEVAVGLRPHACYAPCVGEEANF